MQTLVRRLRGAIGIATTWALLWALLGALLGTIDTLSRPTGGESPWYLAAVLGRVGFLSGLVCAAIIAGLERHRRLSQLSLARVALWGAIGGATIPLLTAVPESQLLWTCPFGAVLAAGSLGMARRTPQNPLSPGDHSPTLPASPVPRASPPSGTTAGPPGPLARGLSTACN